MTDIGFTPEPISAEHRTEDFDCGQPGLNDWLNRRALKNHVEGYTHVRVTAYEGQVVGYYGIASATVIAGAMPRNVRGGQPPDPVPAILIGRFAVDRDWQGKGLGQFLFRDALLRCVAAADLIGARAVIIHALDAKAAAFYSRFGFIATSAEPLTLYQAVQRIRDAV
jgi:predicted N-acetyltransferase YhbS